MTVLAAEAATNPMIWLLCKRSFSAVTPNTTGTIG